MRGPSRATTGGGWVGMKPRKGPSTRPCPRCPAGAFASCLRWHGEFGGEGRWERIATPHRERVSPSTAVADTMLEQTQPCERVDTHGNHWRGANDTRRYCRGLL